MKNRKSQDIRPGIRRFLHFRRPENGADSGTLKSRRNRQSTKNLRIFNKHETAYRINRLPRKPITTRLSGVLDRVVMAHKNTNTLTLFKDRYCNPARTRVKRSLQDATPSGASKVCDSGVAECRYNYRV